MVASRDSLVVPSAPFRGPLEDRISRPQAGEVARLLIIDDHHFVRMGVASLLQTHEWIQVVGHAADGEEGLRRARELSPDLVLVDLMLPKLSGVALTKALRYELPDTRVIFLSMHPPESVAPSVIASGAHGYVCKKVATTELIRALETVASGGTYFGHEFSAPATYDGATSRPLSPREREVLIYIAQGLMSKEIADRLGVGIRTVETHRASLMRKLKIHHVAGLTLFALSHGLVAEQPGFSLPAIAGSRTSNSEYPRL